MKSIKVAIADDHELIRSCIQNCVTLWGYSVVIQASNGKELLNHLTNNNAPDICILDINMPEMNGYETLKELKKKWPAIKTLVFSMSIIQGKKDALLLDADAVLSKMASTTELKMILKQLSQQQKLYSA